MFNILDYIPTGEANAIPSQELADLGGFKSIRDLQAHIEVMRNSGAVICSTCQKGGGYFLPANASELRAFIRTLENRANHTLRSLNSAKQALDDICDA